MADVPEAPKEAPEAKPKAPEVKAPEPEKFYKVAIFQFNHLDGSGCYWKDQIVSGSEFPADELAYLIEIGALVPAPPAAE